MNRRRFMQGLGASAAAGVGLASMSSASAVDAGDILYPQNRLFDGAMRAGAGAGAWLGDQIGGLISQEDLSGYTGGEALWKNSEERLLQLALTNEQALSAMQNTVEFAPNAVLPMAMSTAIEGFNSGESTEEINDAVDDVIEGYVTDVQMDMITLIESIADQTSHILTQIDEFSPASGDSNPFGSSDNYWYNPIFQVNYSSSAQDEYDDWTSLDASRSGDPTFAWGHDSHDSEITLQLADGSTHDTRLSWFTSAEDFALYPQYNPAFLTWDAAERELGDDTDDWDTSNGDYSHDDFVYPFSPAEYEGLLADIANVRVEVGDEMGSFIQDFSAAYEQGDVDLTDAVDPITAYTELRAEDDDNAFAGASAGLLGIPSSGTDPMEIELHESDVIVDGSIYAHESPEGGFTVGESYDPEQLEGPVFMRYSGAFEDEDGNVQEETDFVQLQQSFTIVSALDEDGLEKETVEMVDGPTYDPADVESIEEQLAQVREEQIRLQEQAAQQSGGGFFDELSVGGVPGEIVALAAALIGVGFFAGNK